MIEDLLHLIYKALIGRSEFISNILLYRDSLDQSINLLSQGSGDHAWLKAIDIFL